MTLVSEDLTHQKEGQPIKIEVKYRNICMYMYAVYMTEIMQSCIYEGMYIWMSVCVYWKKSISLKGNCGPAMSLIPLLNCTLRHIFTSAARRLVTRSAQACIARSKPHDTWSMCLIQIWAIGQLMLIHLNSSSEPQRLCYSRLRMQEWSVLDSVWKLMWFWGHDCNPFEGIWRNWPLHMFNHVYTYQPFPEGILQIQLVLTFPIWMNYL